MDVMTDIETSKESLYSLIGSTMGRGRCKILIVLKLQSKFINIAEHDSVSHRIWKLAH